MRCVVFPSSSSAPLSHIYSGFGLLQLNGEIELLWRPGDFGISATSRCRVEVDGVRVVYDLEDGADLDQSLLEWSDVYFKRSYLQSMSTKILPLGLNYPVYAQGDGSRQRIVWALKNARPHNLKEVLVQVGRQSLFLSTLTRANVGRRNSRVEAFESEPRLSHHPIVVCFARTWNPAQVSGEKAENWRALNAMRAGTIRMLRKELGPAFVGGLQDSPDALAAYPDCIVPHEVTARKHYLETMKAADICVSTLGLCQSNGWRMAEYVAASKAVVSEELAYEVPGFFEGIHYLDFASPEGAVGSCVALIEEPERRLKMMYDNQTFYRKHVRPDALVRHSLRQAVATGPQTGTCHSARRRLARG